jgi:outer membrane biogenesis lipoprotein LolB
LRGFRNKSSRRSLVAAALAAMLVSGCAQQPAALSATSQLVTAGTAQTQFSLSGRFSAKNGNEQASGQFRYAQSGPDGTLRQMSLFSPLGTPLAEISADRQSAALTLSNGQVQRAASLTDLMREVIDLPVNDATLSAWLQGLPLDRTLLGAKGVERDASGAPARFVESGWEITISARMDGNFAAPKRMRWSMLGQPDTEVRWVIDEWSTP